MSPFSDNPDAALLQMLFLLPEIIALIYFAFVLGRKVK